MADDIPVPTLVDLTRAAVQDQVEQAEARNALLAVLVEGDRLCKSLLMRALGRQIVRKIAFEFDVRLPSGHPEYDGYYDASDEALAGIHLSSDEHRDGCAR